MDYPFSHFLRHNELWPEARALSDVYPKPDEPGGDQPIHVGADMSEMAVHLRIMHMLSADGCTPDERKYRGPRFFFMQRFIALHRDAIRKAGLMQFDDGQVVTIPNAILRAVHETFRGEPLRHSDREMPEPIIERAKNYTGTWTYE